MDVRPTTMTAPPTPGTPLGFGRLFASHMVRMDYDPQQGWHGTRLEPYAPLALDPGTASLHYGQMVFEGLKAFRGDDDRIRLFRLEDHARRFRRSCERLCIPALPEGAFIEAVEAAVKHDTRWVPSDEGAALYVRPFVFATEPFLGVRPAQTYTFLVILSPVGAYWANGFAPVRIWVEREAVRAAHGGLGAAKTAANYAAGLQAAARAKGKGYDQVLWTDAREHRYLEEVGTMNLFVRIGDQVITPPLGGTILGGITRDSVLRLLRDRGVDVAERRLTLDEVVAAHQRGDLHEVFGTGTAAVVSPVGALGVGDEDDLVVGDGGVGPLARELFDEVVGVQRGRTDDRYGWIRVVS